MNEKETKRIPMLDIIVPHYKEPWEVGEKFFAMLNLQRGIDFSSFRVTVVNDGEENSLSDDHFSACPYPVRQIDIPHAGVSAARNAGLKAAEAEWVMFCDFDDMFSNVYAIRGIMEILPANDFDMLWCKLLTEDLLDGRNMIRYSPEKSNFVFVHGKLYRRKFLLNHDIWFDEELIFNEDSAFNAIIHTYVDYKRTGEINTFAPPYIWCRRKNSVTTTPDRADEAMWGHYRRNLKVCEAHEKRLSYDRFCGMVTRTVFDAYYMVHGDEISAAMKEKIKRDFRSFLVQNYVHFGKVSDKILDEIKDISYRELIKKGEINRASMHAVGEWAESLLKEGDAP